MKLKKTLVALLTCALVLSALSATALAAVHTTKGPDAGGGGDTYVIDTSKVDRTKIDKIEIKISVDSAYVNGTVGYNKDGAWTTPGQLEIKDATSGKWVVENIGGIDADDSEVQVQFWWINPVYDDEGNATGGGTVKVESVKLYDKSGKDLAATEDTSKEEATEEKEETTDNDKKTGDFDLTLVYGLIVICGAGLVLTNVRKNRA